MALQSEAAPPVVGEAKKDIYEGDTKSDEDSEDVDLEEGEIIDSANELEDEMSVPKTQLIPFKTTNEQNISPFSKTQEIIKQAADAIKTEDPDKCYNEEQASEFTHRKLVKKKYLDHDEASDNDDEENEDKDSWYERIARKKQSPTNGPIDYRKELALYAGSPKSSPERDGISDGSKKKKRTSSSKSKLKKIALKRAKRRLLEKRSGKPPRKIISKRPCKFFLEGNCVKGADCPFQHLKPRDRKRELCRYYLTGYCQKGRQCTFMHEDFPCKFFHTGAKCYSGDNCRFSHQPLTEETTRLLQECLKGYHNDDHHESKKRKSKSPEPPSKRPCLLGSPPRHIREAEETKRWQEEMFYLQREKSTDAFHIRLSPPKQFPIQKLPNRPNFYVDTMQSPPKANNWSSCPEQIMGPSQINFEQSNNSLMNFEKSNNSLMNFEQTNNSFEQKLEDEDLRPKLNWSSICALVESMKEPNSPKNVHDDVKLPNNDLESDNSCIDTGQANLKNSSEEYEKPEVKHNSEDEADDSSTLRAVSPRPVSPTQNAEPVIKKEPIHIPSHLPRKQRELLLRIQRHQKSKSTESEDTTESGEKLEAEGLSDLPFEAAIKKEVDEEKCWTSSDDDDDEDADEPLTDVLKKLHETPPPKPKEIPPRVPQIDISQMLSNIMQKANENSKTGLPTQEQGTFWQNILSGAVLPSNATTTCAPVISLLSNEAQTTEPSQATKRRVLLPNPKPVEPPANTESRDPRLKNRDPRTTAIKPISESGNNAPPPPFPLLPLETKAMNLIGNHHDTNSVVLNQTSAVVVDGLAANVPYKLYTVAFTPLNYKHVQISHSDPKLANDPRLRKYMSQEVSIPSAIAVASNLHPKAASLPDLPLFTNVKMETPSQDAITLASPTAPAFPQQCLQVADPRSRRPEDRNKNTPISQTNDNQISPAGASHLPRSIADPRMAKLQRPLLDPRRSRLAADTANKNSTANRLQPSSLEVQRPQGDVERTNDETGNARKSSDIYRNRKTSMDYASPLSSCNDNASSLNYNQRPKNHSRHKSVEVPLPKETLPSASSLANSLIPEFSTSDSSNLDCDSSDASASLKDMFKTIDPTASPFC